MKSIGEVAKLLDVSQHTLRYYEKIGLLAPIAKNDAGRRQFSAADIERLRFIKRAQRMHFSLDEIRSLIELDRAVSVEKSQARALVREKLSEVENGLKDLRQLKKDLSIMLVACEGSDDDEDCPIIEGIKRPQADNQQ
ncbi:MAG: MerR family transcriptional regulator [Arenicella sp.]|nr:MerR family transcriptional regulator [Arenicella sp.]